VSADSLKRKKTLPCLFILIYKTFLGNGYFWQNFSSFTDFSLNPLTNTFVPFTSLRFPLPAWVAHECSLYPLEWFMSVPFTCLSGPWVFLLPAWVAHECPLYPLCCPWVFPLSAWVVHECFLSLLEWPMSVPFTCFVAQEYSLYPLERPMIVPFTRLSGPWVSPLPALLPMSVPFTRLSGSCFLSLLEWPKCVPFTHMGREQIWNVCPSVYGTEIREARHLTNNITV